MMELYVYKAIEWLTEAADKRESVESNKKNKKIK